jgi:hypothetical protein
MKKVILFLLAAILTACGGSQEGFMCKPNETFCSGGDLLGCPETGDTPFFVEPCDNIYETCGKCLSKGGLVAACVSNSVTCRGKTSGVIISSVESSSGPPCAPSCEGLESDHQLLFRLRLPDGELATIIVYNKHKTVLELPSTLVLVSVISKTMTCSSSGSTSSGQVRIDLSKPFAILTVKSILSCTTIDKSNTINFLRTFNGSWEFKPFVVIED